ncbi:MAG: polyphenol oxidase family protein [bacterium]|nr:polyphenol oxidase family protein [bacterium]
MIRPPGFAGAAFGTAESGDLRRDALRRAHVAKELGVAPEWAYLNQVHGVTVHEATRSGNLGDGDAIVSFGPGIPIMVATADCAPVVVEAETAVAVVHAGWRGAAAGVLPATLGFMREAGHEPVRAAIGPAIGPCCYEVGQEVAERFAGFRTTTTWGAVSVDIPAYLEDQLGGVDTWRSDECTFTSDRFHSWRRDHTDERQVTVAWLPSN